MIYKITHKGGYSVKGAKANQAIMKGADYCETCSLDLRGMGIMVYIDHEDHVLIEKHPLKNILSEIKNVR